MCKCITEEVIDFIKRGYTDDQINKITGWEMEFIINARRVIDANNKNK